MHLITQKYIYYCMQVDTYYPFHPSSRVGIKSETRLKALPQQAEKWIKEMCKKDTLVLQPQNYLHSLFKQSHAFIFIKISS